MNHHQCSQGRRVKKEWVITGVLFREGKKERGNKKGRERAKERKALVVRGAGILFVPTSKAT